jgi:hypothetical protein
VGDIDKLIAASKSWTDIYWAPLTGPQWEACRRDIRALADACEELRRENERLRDEHKKLLAVLRNAKHTICAWHGGMGWTQYQQSPEMQEINAALSASPQKETT